MSTRVVVVSRMESDIHPEQIHGSREVASVVDFRFVIAMGVLKIVGSKQPVQTERLWNCHQQDELSPIKDQQPEPQNANQANLQKQISGKSSSLRPFVSEFAIELWDQHAVRLNRMKHVTQQMIVVATESIRSRLIFGAVLMDVVVAKMTSVNHRAGHCRANADQQVGYVVETLAVPNAKVNVVVVHDLHAD